MIVILFFIRTNSKRLKWTKAEIYISSFYILFTLGNKIYMDSIFEKPFKKAGIAIDRFSAQPSTLNTVLWYAVSETKEKHHLTFYSLLDESATTKKVISIDKNL